MVDKFSELTTTPLSSISEIPLMPIPKMGVLVFESEEVEFVELSCGELITIEGGPIGLDDVTLITTGKGSIIKAG